jgi:hypothetical protein
MSDAFLASGSKAPEVWDDWANGATSNSITVPRAPAVASAPNEWRGSGGLTSDSISIAIPLSSTLTDVMLVDRGRAFDCNAPDQIKSLKITGLTTVNLYNFLLGRGLAPLRSRDHYMWEYTWQNDDTRLIAAEWDVAEYVKALGKITTVTFTTFKADKQPYSPQ